MSRTLTFLAAVILVVIATTTISNAVVVNAYTSHEHYHGHISQAAKNYNGPAHIYDHKFLENLESGAPGAQEVCVAGGEFRRKHKCISVKHTKKDVCCWHAADGMTGVLPHSCCGVGWKEHNCEKIIEQLCSSHDGTMKAYYADLNARLEREAKEKAQKAGDL